MTEKQRITTIVKELTSAQLMDLALRIDALKLYEVEILVLYNSAREIREILKDMGIIKR